MIPPPRLLWVLGAGLHIQAVILRPALLLGRGEHRDDGQADGLYGQGRRPVVRQDGEADVSVAVDVLVERDAVPDKGHLGRVEGILQAELEAEQKGLALVEGVGRPLHAHQPDAEVVARQGLLAQAHALRRLRGKRFELLLEALEGRPGDFVSRRLVHVYTVLPTFLLGLFTVVYSCWSP